MVEDVVLSSAECKVHTQCPRCFSPGIYVSKVHTTETVKGTINIFCIVDCSCCTRKFFVEAEYRDTNEEGSKTFKLVDTYPYAATRMTITNLPGGMPDEFAEAFDSYHRGKFRSAVMMARLLLERTTKKLGAKQNRLADAINELAKDGTLSLEIKELAHEIRLLGNIGSHADDALDKITKEEADYAMDLLCAFLNHVYCIPAKLNRSRARREQLKKSP